MNSNTDSEKVKQGRRNKAKSRTSEIAEVKKYEKWGFDAERQPLSGALKGKHRGDIKVKIKKKWRIHEDKKRSNVEHYYDRVKTTGILYNGFCVMLSQDDYKDLLSGGRPRVITQEDKKLKTIHNYFNQDNADIVSVKQHGRNEAVYFVSLNFWEELVGSD